MPSGPGWDRTDPFAEGAGPFVATGPHGRAVEAVLAALAQGERRLHLHGAAGVGKTRVAEAIARSWREPGRRVARCDAGAGVPVADALVHQMGGGTARAGSRGDPWVRLTELARLARAQRQRWLLVVDGCESREAIGDLERLARLGARHESAVALLTVGASGTGAELDGVFPDDRTVTIGLPALTRSEAVEYLASKLTARGWDAGLLSSEAATRLHAATRGVPRPLDRLARRVLDASAGRAVSAEDVDRLVNAEPLTGWAA